MRRLLWLGIGLAVGALAVRAVTKKARQFTPAGLAAGASRSVGGVSERVRLFIDDVRDGMAERTDQIHAAFVDGEGDPDETFTQEGTNR